MSLEIGVSCTDPNRAVAEARAAERLGFDYVASGEHLFFHGPTTNVFVQLAAAAGATSTIGLVSTVSLLPLYPATLAAKMVAVLDQVSGGRFQLGVGAGGEYPEEFHAVGVDPRARFRRLDEHLDVLLTLLDARGTSSFDGEFTRFSEVRIDPAPHRPRVPVWVGGRGEGAIRRAAKHGDVWMPYLVSPARLRDGMEQLAGAVAAAGRPELAVEGALFAWMNVDRDGKGARREGVTTVSTTYRQDFTDRADRYLLLGDPDEVGTRIGDYVAAGARRLILQVAAPPERHAAVLETFAGEVLPQFRRPATAGS